MKVADGPVTLELVRTGNRDDPGTSYLRWREYHDGTESAVYVHQLSAIAGGADPWKVFSNGDYQTHHEDGIPENNARENLRVVLEADHCRINAKERT